MRLRIIKDNRRLRIINDNWWFRIGIYRWKRIFYTTKNWIIVIKWIIIKHKMNYSGGNVGVCGGVLLNLSLKS